MIPFLSPAGPAVNRQSMDSTDSTTFPSQLHPLGGKDAARYRNNTPVFSTIGYQVPQQSDSSLPPQYDRHLQEYHPREEPDENVGSGLGHYHQVMFDQQHVPRVSINE